jgi:histidinol phosphatase-like enzyme (inositol monophosphatase family)
MSEPQDPTIARLELARRIAQEAGQLTLQYFRRDDLRVERKADDSPVTIADREAENLLRRRIAAVFADDGIVGEEFPETEGTSPYKWILDPIDGTKSFVSGVPLYGTLVGVTQDDDPVVGVINIPALDESIHAACGRGAWYVRGNLAPRPARVSSVGKLADGLFCTSEIATFAKRRRQRVFEGLQDAAWLTRTWGDCYGYLLLATGRAEVMVDPELHVWDAAAVLPVVQEAGGTFTDWQGRATIHAGEAIATNGHVLDEVLALTQGT